MHSSHACTKTGEPVLDVFWAKNIETYAPLASSLNSDSGVDLPEDTVIEVMRSLSGGANTEGTDSVILQHWLLCFGEASVELRQISVEFTEGLANVCPTWDTYARSSPAA